MAAGRGCHGVGDGFGFRPRSLRPPWPLRPLPPRSPRPRRPILPRPRRPWHRCLLRGPHRPRHIPSRPHRPWRLHLARPRRPRHPRLRWIVGCHPFPPPNRLMGGWATPVAPAPPPAPLLPAQILAAPGGTIDAAAAGRIVAPPWPPLGPGPPGDPPSHPKNQGPPATRLGALKHDALPAKCPGNAVPLRTPHGQGAQPQDVAKGQCRDATGRDMAAG